MRPALAVMMFFVMVLLIGMIYNVLNSFAFQPLMEAVENTSLPQNPYPVLTALYAYLWSAIVIIAVVATAIYLSNRRANLGGGYY